MLNPRPNSWNWQLQSRVIDIRVVSVAQYLDMQQDAPNGSILSSKKVFEISQDSKKDLVRRVSKSSKVCSNISDN